MRECKGSWIETYLEYTKNSRPPDIYHKWVAVSAIAGALQRRVGIKTGFYNVFPNHYIILVGPPACGKSTACAIGSAFLEKLDNVSFTSQSSTREALIHKLEESYHIVPDERGTLTSDGLISGIEQSALTAYINEFSSVLASDQINMLEFLTDIYDTPTKTWTHSTVTRGDRKITEPCLNLISATTQKRLIELLPQSAIEGGFVSRTIFVYADTPRKAPVWYTLSNYELSLRDSLNHDMKEIAAMRGDFSLTQKAMDLYSDWFEMHTSMLRSDFMEGFVERKHTHIQKLAMILSVSEDNTKIIEKRHIEQAIKWLDEVEPLVKRAFAGSGTNKRAAFLERIAYQIRSRGTANFAELLETNFHDIDLEELEAIIITLRKTNKVKDYMQGTARLLTWISKEAQVNE